MCLDSNYVSLTTSESLHDTSGVEIDLMTRTTRTERALSSLGVGWINRKIAFILNRRSFSNRYQMS